MGNKPILYYVNSPANRTVMIVAKIIDVELELKHVDLLNGEHKQKWFLELNPEHTVPTLVDNNFSIWDSHAISMYLIDKYAKTDQLYPKDLQTRARCNQRLFFDSNLFVRFRDCSYHIIFDGNAEVPQDKIQPLYTAFDTLESFVSCDLFLVGNSFTLADVAVASTATAAMVFAPLNSDKYPNILAWLNRINGTVPEFEEINTKNVEKYRQLIESSIERNKMKR